MRVVFSKGNVFAYLFFDLEFSDAELKQNYAGEHANFKFFFFLFLFASPVFSLPNGGSIMDF